MGMLRSWPYSTRSLVQGLVLGLLVLAAGLVVHAHVFAGIGGWIAVLFAGLLVLRRRDGRHSA
jgi:uncharacterized membrane protein